MKKKKYMKPTVDEIVDAALEDDKLVKKYQITRYFDDNLDKCAFRKKDNIVVIDTLEYEDHVDLVRYDHNDVSAGFVSAKSLDEILEALRYFTNHKKLPNEDVP